MGPGLLSSHVRIFGLVLLATASFGWAPGAGAGAMVTSGPTSQPIGHYEFCKSNPRECALRTPDSGPVALDKNVWKKVSGVNLSVNHAVKPMSDVDIYGRDEVWAYPERGIGDCEDYVLEKRRQLNAGGIALSNLLITVVRKPDGEGHAVLTVRTDRGDFVLDNLRDDIRRWDETGYRFLKRQSSNHAGRWVSLREEQNMMVGSVRK